MSNALEVLKRIVREEYKNIKDGVNIHPDGFRDYTPEEDSDFDEPHSTEKMESVNKECCDNCNEGKTCCSVTEKKTMKITKTRIKEIIREEIKSVLTEGTRWLVGIEAPSGKIVSTYGHYDGYPEHAGKMLKRYYNNTGKVKQLMKLGKQGISTIDKSIKGGKDHSFKNPAKGETVFYGRDRGEKSRMSSTWGNRDKVKFNSGEEFAYIWSAKDKKWYYKSRYSNPQDWTELK